MVFHENRRHYYGWLATSRHHRQRSSDHHLYASRLHCAHPPSPSSSRHEPLVLPRDSRLQPGSHPPQFPIPAPTTHQIRNRHPLRSLPCGQAPSSCPKRTLARLLLGSLLVFRFRSRRRACLCPKDSNSRVLFHFLRFTTTRAPYPERPKDPYSARF